MNTLLMEAYEALLKIAASRTNDPQAALLKECIEHMASKLEDDEIAILNFRARQKT